MRLLIALPLLAVIVVLNLLGFLLGFILTPLKEGMKDGKKSFRKFETKLTQFVV